MELDSRRNGPAIGQSGSNDPHSTLAQLHPIELHHDAVGGIITLRCFMFLWLHTSQLPPAQAAQPGPGPYRARSMRYAATVSSAVFVNGYAYGEFAFLLPALPGLPNPLSLALLARHRSRPSTYRSRPQAVRVPLPALGSAVAAQRRQEVKSQALKCSDREN